MPQVTARSERPTITTPSLIRSRADRTPERMRAIHLVDDLCKRAFTGLQPSQRVERIASTHDGFARGPDRQEAAREEIRQLVRKIGEEPFSILYHRIHQRDEYSKMERRGFGDAERLGQIFLHALDGAARFYGLTPPSASVVAMLENVGGQPAN